MWSFTELIFVVGLGLLLVLVLVLVLALVLRALVTGRFMSTGDVREAQDD